ncbi:MAG: beta-ketoacyl-[acyl-carrier-protein] synthase family protein [Candidatus Sumerlaeota bacterium]|nr:beta-ketoacyl-[acyl-carrier-protein] synthase family protein [Candidatus Sumerlaeota bacterium]
MRRAAITGFGVVSAVGNGRENFWRALAEGRSGIRPISRFDASTFEVRLAGEVTEALALPEDAALIARDDPKTGFAFAACAEALAQAGIDRLGPRALLHAGASLETFDLKKLIINGKLDFQAVMKRALEPGASRLQYPLDTAIGLIEKHFGRAARTLTNCSACAAGAQAIGHGFRAIREGRFDVAVCGGFDSMINPLGVGGFQLLGALTTNNELGAYACRPFDAARAGTVLGEGAAFVVLEPLESALAAGKTILAEICGYGSSLDAHSLTAPDPEGNGAIRAMTSALEDAKILPSQIGHINAHGTGTQLNDEVEAQAIRKVFASAWEWIPVSATKSMTGHCIAAAGAIEVGACLLALVRRSLPPNPCLARVAAGCELNHVMQPGALFDGEYALSNSFGFGGQNAALVLRKA